MAIDIIINVHIIGETITKYHIIYIFLLNNIWIHISDRMPKAKFKRKGVPELSVQSKKSKYSEITNLDSSLTEKTLEIPEDVAGFPVSLGIPCSTPVSEVPGATPYRTLLDLPEELICLILVRLPVSSISNLEITCKHLQRVLVNAR